MSTNTELRNQFKNLRRNPGPGPGWLARAAKELGYSPGHISRVNRGLVTSPSAVAALNEWKRLNLPETA